MMAINFVLLLAAVLLCQQASIVEGKKRNKCGKPKIAPDLSGARIVNGNEAVPHSWPWQVRILTSRYVCGGAIISKQYIISAAHCFTGDDEQGVNVYAGGHEIDSGDEYEVDKIRMHPKWVPKTYENDIAVLKLKKPIKFDKTKRSICLPKKLAPVGDDLVVTGWGDLEHDGSMADNLMQVVVPLLSDKECKESYGEADIYDGMFCAGGKDKDSCQGDSGGPAVRQLKNGKWQLQGIVSWGYGCATPGYPGVYTQVADYKKWIKKAIKSM